MDIKKMLEYLLLYVKNNALRFKIENPSEVSKPIAEALENKEQTNALIGSLLATTNAMLVKDKVDEADKKIGELNKRVEELNDFKGEDGKTPEKGTDYFTEKEIKEWRKAVTPVVGKDFFTEAEKKQFISYIEKRIVIPEPKNGETPVAGIDYPTHEQVAKYVDELVAEIPVPENGKTPNHEWKGTKVRFQNPDGSWGKWSELKGKDGEDARKTPIFGDNGARFFRDLLDTPRGYQGGAGKYLRVKTTEDGIEYATVSGSGTVETIVAGNNIDVDATDPANPIVSVETLTIADISGITASADEINVLDGIPATLTATELGYVDGVTSAIQTQLNAKAADADVVHDTGDETVAGVKTFSSDPIIPDEAYGAGWNGSLEPATKNAIYDKIETLGGGGNVSKVGTPVDNQVGVWTGDGTLEGDANLTFTGQLLTLTNTTDAASVQAAIIQGDRATIAANDEAYLTLRLSDSAGNQDEYARLTWRGTTVTSGSEAGRLLFSVRTAGTLAEELFLSGTSLSPTSNDGLALGVGGAGFADLFLASGAVIDFASTTLTLTQSSNTLTLSTLSGVPTFAIKSAGIISWGSGNATLTHSTGLLTSNVPLSLGTSNALTAGTIELGHATDTTISRSAAGVIAVEGVVIPSISSTNTLTNKRITQRVVTAADDATAVIDVDTTDQYQLTAMANATTVSTTGTPTAGQKLTIRLKDNGTARGLTWDSVFRAIGVTLPTTTVISKTVYIGCIYNSTDSKWDAVAVAQEA